MASVASSIEIIVATELQSQKYSIWNLIRLIPHDVLNGEFVRLSNFTTWSIIYIYIIENKQKKYWYIRFSTKADENVNTSVGKMDVFL